ncbi:hypothetical protein GBAR_LOCUS779 [Geodia barretti]|uniref:Uncharacterized protein n=1 Tax=Geodia barretti TaxID=519541 RepID=A0AA35W3W2_GEOBA|nr:hypothetical protein GBAR_LOCUS779 [Geodia barretti]
MACKDALTSPFFANINEMLLRLNHLYKKSPKELTMIVEELKEVYQFRKGGSLPVRCQGTRWISYKGKALQRVVDRFGAYDLAALIEDSTVKKVQNLDGKMRERLEWTDVKLLRAIPVFLDTCSWAARGEMTDDYMAEIRAAVEHIVTVFQEPLEAKWAHDELEEVVHFCRRY